MPDVNWLTITEAAQRLNVWPEEVRGQVEQGYLPAHACPECGRHLIQDIVVESFGHNLGWL